jgi:hypothetical protein
MGALPAVANVIKQRIFYTVEGDPMAVTILHWHYSSGAPSDPDLQAFSDAMATAAASGFLPLMNSGVTLDSLDARDISRNDGAYATSAVASAGTRTGSRLAPGTAAVVNYSIRQSYRGGKPRSYFPFGVSADVAATGLWADAFVAAVDSGLVTFLGAGFATFGDLVVDNYCAVSYYGPPNKLLTNPTTGRVRTVSTRRDAPGGTGHPLTYIINSHTTSKTIGSQRRRNRNA